jgi:hypothetical protein
MEEIKSGKELCDNFFENLLKREDIDLQVANLFKDLYSSGKFTKNEILQGLQSLRQDSENEQQSQTKRIDC